MLMELLKLHLVRADWRAMLVEDDESGTRGPLIYGTQERTLQLTRHRVLID